MSKERNRLVKKLDLLCREILLIRDEHAEGYCKCVSCGKVIPLKESNVSHYISRRHESCRWDLKNIHLSCVHCNKWLAGNLIEYRKELVRRYGAEEVEKMEALYRENPRYKAFDLKLIEAELKKILRNFSVKKTS